MAPNRSELPATDPSVYTTTADVTSRLEGLSLDGSARGRSSQQTTTQTGNYQQSQKPSTYGERSQYEKSSRDKETVHHQASLMMAVTNFGSASNASERAQAVMSGLKHIEFLQQREGNPESPQKSQDGKFSSRRT
ncbi:uncharacterized protein L203_104732 [Cryptococcus depauperatus CBS 7841]|uniref:Uncharacterized protein n=1 Tax=Cryptococcus depauperatus CBS 7841 TaxID=1295531 RepID=A0A1E3HD25_9TREE|nr:hypothetical protein L203_06648 [Cryptococcus depauperatus CBS 7841]